jgi:hypothetical protein
LQSGAVAQLGERVNGIHEVRGSIPLSSTKKVKSPLKSGPFILNDESKFMDSRTQARTGS